MLVAALFEGLLLFQRRHASTGEPSGLPVDFDARQLITESTVCTAVFDRYLTRMDAVSPTYTTLDDCRAPPASPGAFNQKGENFASVDRLATS
jgi:hypothetical protein